jgi:hypothetical protein
MVVHAANKRSALLSTDQRLLLVRAGAAPRRHGAAGDRALGVAQNEVFDLLDREAAVRLGLRLLGLLVLRLTDLRRVALRLISLRLTNLRQPMLRRALALADLRIIAWSEGVLRVRDSSWTTGLAIC